MTISELKRDARIKLSGKWGLAIGINLVYMLLYFILGIIASFIGNAIVLLILMLALAVVAIPLSYGITASMMKLSREEQVKVTDFITIGFNNFSKPILLYLSVLVRLLLPFIVMVGILLIGSLADSSILSVVVLIACIACLIWLFYKALSYTLSTFLLVDNPEASSKDIIKKSCELMNGRKLKYFGLVFSFIGWILLFGIISAIIQSFAGELLGNIISYIPSLILAPYIAFSEINFYEDAANIANVNKPSVEE